MKGQLPPLSRLARQARGNADLLADLLFTYQEINGMSDEALSAFLECEVDAMPKLALCKRPRPAPNFRGDLARIAAYTGASAPQLARLIRSVDARAALRRSPGRDAPTLQAARDREDESALDGGQGQPDLSLPSGPGGEQEDGSPE